MKKSARAYGSTTAWKEASASRRESDCTGRTSFLPPTPTKLPITAISGLKIFDAALAFP